MTELFNLIMQYPLEFLAGLGFGSSAAYGIIALIKWVVRLFTKKSAKAKELAKNNAIATAVIKALGGVDGFCDRVANIVITTIAKSATVNELKQYLTDLANKETCPVEIKAYIDTVLSQSGSEQLQLLYEQTKAALINHAKTETENTINDGKEQLEPTLESEPVEEIVITAQETPSTATPSEDEDIDYA